MTREQAVVAPVGGYLNYNDLEKYMVQNSTILPIVDRTSKVYAKRIVLSGTHGTGKTTLFNYLQHELKKLVYAKQGLHYVFREEPIRLIQKYGFPINQNAGDASQLAMAAYHMATLNYDYFVSDRCIVDLYVYARYLSECHNTKDAVVSSKCVSFLEQLVYQFVAQFKGIVFMFHADPLSDIAKDDVRDTDVNFRNEIQSMLMQVWAELSKETHNYKVHVEFMPDHFADRVHLVTGCISDPDFQF